MEVTKKHRRRKSSFNFKQFSATILLVMILCLTQISLVSALEFDNIKDVPEDFNYKTDTITITNSFLFLFPLGKVADIKLLENTDQALIEGRAIFEVILYEDYYDPISNVEFFNDVSKKLDNVRNVRWYWFDDSSYEVDIPKYEEVCVVSEDVKNATEVCTQEVKSTRKEIRYNNAWVLYEPKGFDTGTYKFKLIADKQIHSKVDFVPELFGVKLPEYAWWDSDWKKSKEVSITGGTEGLINFTVMINITYDSDILPDFTDIRFINGTCGGVQDIELDYEWDLVNNSISAITWVRIPALSSGINKICMYYNNSVATDGSDRENAWDKNYGGIYHFSEGGGMLTNDSIGTGNGLGNASYVLNPGSHPDSGWMTGVFGNSIETNTSNRMWIDILSQMDVLIGNEMTMESYGYANSYTANDNMLLGGANGAIGLASRGDASLQLAQPGVNRVISTLNITKLQWNYMAVSMNISKGNSLNFMVNVTNYTSTEANLFNFASMVGTSLYFGDSQAGEQWLGRIDEFRFSNISRSLAWMNRSGQNYDMSLVTFGAESENTALDIITTLNIPATGFSTTNVSTTANSSAQVFNGNITNMTYYLWNSSHDLVSTDTKIVSGEGGIDGYFNVSEGILTTNNVGDYNWNVLACVTNATGYKCAIASTNNTLNRVSFSEDETFFVHNVSETDNQFFQLNISTIEDILSIDARLNYNNTEHNAQSSCVGNKCTLFTIIDIPLVESGEQMNTSFFWNLTIFDGTTSSTQNSSTFFQNISRIHLELCNATFTTKALNFSLFDEQNLTRLIPMSFGGTFNQWLGSGTTKRNNSISKNATEVNLCLFPNHSISIIEAIIDYNEITTGDYTQRNYFFQNYNISSTQQDIPLYVMLSASSTSFILKVQDENLLPVSDALIETHRFYPGEGIFKIVQIARTDDNGKSIGFFVTETVDYKFIIKKNGVVLLETGQQKVIPETSPFTLTFNIGGNLGESWTSQNDIPNLISNLTWNEASGVVTYTYIDTSSNFTSSRLLVQQQSLVNTTAYLTVCNDTSVLSSSTITCTVGNSSGFYIASSFITRSGESLDLQITFYIETFSSVVGFLGLFFGWFLILIASSMFKFNEVAGIWATTITIFLVNLMGLIKFGAVFVTAIIGIAVILTWVMEK